MIDERVLERSPLVLDRRARERYFEDGFLAVPGYVGAAWLDRLRAVVAGKVEESRALSASDDQFDLAPDHSAEKPNIRRLRKAVDQHPELWAFAQDPTVVDLVADVLGPDVRFHSSKLNFKWSDGGDAVRWHQDIQAWPHTSFSVLTFGVYLDDTSSAQGPLTALPGTHRGPLFDQFDDGGRWTGALSARDAATLPTDRVAEMCGPAGTVVLIHCRVSTRVGRQLLGAPSTAAPQRVLCGRHAADHAGAGAHEADGRAGARPGAPARPHGAVSGPPATALGPGRLSLDLRRSDRGATGAGWTEGLSQQA